MLLPLLKPLPLHHLVQCSNQRKLRLQASSTTTSSSLQPLPLLPPIDISKQDKHQAPQPPPLQSPPLLIRSEQASSPMEGLIPFVYRAIVQYRNAGPPPVGSSSWFDESTSGGAVYMRLLGDSGRFQAQEIQLFNSSPSRGAYSAPAPVQSPHRRSTSRRHT